MHVALHILFIFAPCRYVSGEIPACFYSRSTGRNKKRRPDRRGVRSRRFWRARVSMRMHLAARFPALLSLTRSPFPKSSCSRKCEQRMGNVRGIKRYLGRHFLSPFIYRIQSIAKIFVPPRYLFFLYFE